MIKVKTTDAYKKNHVIDKELRIIPKEGYEFEVSEERYRILTKDNDHNLKFVEKIKKEKVTENQEVQGSE